MHFLNPNFKDINEYPLDDAWAEILTDEEIKTIKDYVNSTGYCREQLPIGFREIAFSLTEKSLENDLSVIFQRFVKNKDLMKKYYTILYDKANERLWDTNPMTKEHAMTVGWGIDLHERRIDDHKGFIVPCLRNYGLKGNLVEFPTSINGYRVSEIYMQRLFHSENPFEVITIPESIITVESSALYKFTNLKKIISKSPYYRVENDRFLIRNVDDKLIAVASCQLEAVVVPNSVKIIGADAFCFNECICSVEIPKSVTRIERNAFYACKKLSIVKIKGNIEKLEGKTFTACANLTTIELPDSITIIDDCVFFGCYKLENINLSKALIKLGEQCFSDCRSLNMIVLPDKTEEIKSYCFSNCEKLNLTIPNSVHRIRPNAFDGVSHVEYRGKSKSVNNWGAISFN